MSNVFRKPGTDRGACISPSAKYPGKWQMTTFDARGFMRDFEAADEAAARALLLSMNYTEEMDPEEFAALALTERFQAGCELTYLINIDRTEEQDIRFYYLCAVVNCQPIPPDHAERVRAMRGQSH